MLTVVTAAPSVRAGNRFPALDDWRLVARAGVDLLAVDVALRLGGLRRAMAPGEGHGAEQPERPVDADDRRRAARYARWIGATARRHAVRARCLHRALVLHRWLRSEGLPSELRIGVRKADGRLHAHAWVELAGQPVAEPAHELAGFTRLPNLDGALGAGGGGLWWS